MMLAEHRSGGAFRADSLSALAVSAVGLHATMLALWLLVTLYGLDIAQAEAIGAIFGSTVVYAVVEALAFRRRGGWRWYLGLPPFLLSCTCGIVAAVLLAVWAAGQGVGWMSAGLLGGLMGAAWNHGAVGRHGWRR
jgi:putative flippase GtrA